jgi:hypothetical protein
MKQALITIFLSILLTVANGCAGKHALAEPQKQETPTDRATNSFAIYLTTELATNGSGFDWSHAQLKSPPIIADTDILAVDLTNRIIKLKPGVIDRLPDPLTTHLPILHGMPFVCVVEGERVFPGLFWTWLSSFGSPAGAMIFLDRIPGQNVVFLGEVLRQPGAVSPWSDPRLRACLEELHKLGYVSYP